MAAVPGANASATLYGICCGASKPQGGRRDGGLREIPDLVETLADRQRIGDRMQREHGARLLEMELVPHAVVVGDHAGVRRVARLRDGAMDLDRHRELAQQDEQSRAFALEQLRLVQRDEEAMRAAAHEELAQLGRARW